MSKYNLSIVDTTNIGTNLVVVDTGNDIGTLSGGTLSLGTLQGTDAQGKGWSILSTTNIGASLVVVDTGNDIGTLSGSAFTLGVLQGAGAQGKGWTGVSYDNVSGTFVFTSDDGLSYTSDNITADLDAAVAAAQAAEAATEFLFNQFGDQYLGAHATDPTVDTSGNPLTDGDIYFNTTDSVLKFYTGTAWVAPEAIATTAASEALASQVAAELAETNASASASTATTKASEASTSASNAAASYDAFDDRYLGAKASAPTLDNDGNALLTGALYWNTTTTTLSVWDGSTWNQGAFDSAGFLLLSNNLSDLNDAATARTNLGLSAVASTGDYADLLNTPAPFDPNTLATVATTGDYADLTNTPAPFDPNTLATVATTGAYSDLSGLPTLGTAAATASTAYATAAQGTLATNALPRAGGAMTGAITTNSTFDGRNVSVDGAKLDGIEAGATADQTAAQLLAAIKTVDGAGSGLDADLLDGLSSASYLQNNGSGTTLTLSNWIRTTGATGWYNATYGGGFHMQDTTWLRAYNGKKIYVSSTATDAINTAGGVQCATIRGGVPSTSASAAGSVGSYSFAEQQAINVPYKAIGSTLAGSSLQPCSIFEIGQGGNGTLSGTWRLMGSYATTTSYNDYPISLWLRIS